MERTLIGNLGKKIGETVSIGGWVDVARNQGKMAFFDFRDRSGKVQGVVFGKPEVLEVAQKLKQEWVVRIEGKVNERPEKMRRDVPNGNIELEITGIAVLSEAHALPFDKDAELNIDTHFDNLPLTLRLERTRDIFGVQATIVDAFRAALKEEGFTEFQAPVLVGGDAEGGAAVFKIEDYYGKQAYLATSGQLYKQIMVGPFERSMTVAKTFRAEKSATTRHLSELTQLEFEMGFVESHTDVMAMLEKVIRRIAGAVAEKHAAVLKRMDTEPALLPESSFPVFTLLEAQEIIEKEFGGKAVGELDLEPEHEKQICQHTKEKFGSDFVFITHFPTKKRAFYTFADPENPELSRSFDLLFRGLEINSGSQRIHNYDELVAKMQSRGMDPAKFAFYLQAFKYGMPPHGGCSTGLERITMKMLGLGNVKEASAFPRDMNRIDTLLSAEKKKE
ncbi:MAG TPA: aspartate--tRNA(Asn) ligase [Candidatus Paceibacterota bacterium]|nr:aspartate--tRNA(Asn) ligase [Candidatus Paceibacterota bacterium]